MKVLIAGDEVARRKLANLVLSAGVEEFVDARLAQSPQISNKE